MLVESVSMLLWKDTYPLDIKHNEIQQYTVCKYLFKAINSDLVYWDFEQLFTQRAKTLWQDPNIVSIDKFEYV